LLIKIVFGNEKQKKKKISTPPFPPAPFPRLNFSPSFLIPLPPPNPRQFRADEK